MKEQNIESFLKSINCTDPGMGLDNFTDVVIANLPSEETYSFKVVYKVNAYVPSDKFEMYKNGKKFLDDRMNFLKGQLPDFKMLLSKLNVNYSDNFGVSTIGISIDVDINAQQAKQLKSNGLIKHLYAYNPFIPKPQSMLLDKSMLKDE